MAQFMVKVSFDGTQTQCDPARLAVKPGDIVQWSCQDGTLAIDFGPEAPFTSTQVWRAHRNELTPKAIVKPDLLSGKEFRPTMEIDGKRVSDSLGVIVRPDP